jgi:hypothetical protein
LYLGDLNDERKECTQTQISAHAVGSDGYHDRDLAYVRPGMQHGNTGILSRNMPYHLLTITFLVQLTVSAFALWLAMKLTKEEGSLLGLFAAAFIASLAGLLPIPYFSGLFSFIVLLILVSKFTTAEIWPDAALIVVVAWGLATLANFALMMALR